MTSKTINLYSYFYCSKIFLSGRDEEEFLQTIKGKLCSYYRKEFSEMALIEDKRGTDDLFLEPELECKVDGKTERQLKSCDEVLYLKLSKQKCIEKYLLLVGRPGSGKSTIVNNRLAYDWAMGRKHDEIDLLIVINMNTIGDGADLLDIIDDQLLIGVNKRNEDELRKLLENNAKSCLFIFDGFDGDPKALQKLKYLSGVLNNTWLHGSQVIVSVRPDKEYKFHKSFKGFTSVYLNGFSDGKVDRYVEKIFSKSKLPEFKKALRAYPPWLSWLRTNPLTLSMLCYLWKEDNCLPSGITLLYRAVIESLQVQARIESDGETEQAMLDLGKYALETILGKKVQITEREKSLLQIPFSMGICSLQQERKKGSVRKGYTFLKFLLHKSFQEYCAAVYITDLVESNHDEFSSNIHAIADRENVLKFCCGLSTRAAYFILELAVDELQVNDAADSQSASRSNFFEETCIFGIGVNVKNSLKLPLSLLFEAESQSFDMSDEPQLNSEYKLAQLHAMLEPLVGTVQMKCKNWPADPEMLHILEYFKTTTTNMSWLRKVRTVSILLETSNVNLTPGNVRKQTSLVKSMPRLEQLCIKSVSSEMDGNLVLDNLPTLGNAQDLGSLKVVISQCAIDVEILAAFLSRQTVPIQLTLQSILFSKKAKSMSSTPIVFLKEINVVECTSSSHNMDEILGAILANLEKPTTLRWSSTLSVAERGHEKQLRIGQQINVKLGMESPRRAWMESSRHAFSTQALDESWTESSQSWTESSRRALSTRAFAESCTESSRRAFSIQSQPYIEQKTSLSNIECVKLKDQTRRRSHRDSFKIEAFSFNCFILTHLPRKIIGNLCFSKCALKLQSLCNLLQSQHVLHEFKLHDVFLFGQLEGEYDFNNIKRCSLLGVEFSDNATTFLRKFSGITGIVLSGLNFADDALGHILISKSLQNINICNCKFNGDLCSSLLLLPPFATLNLEQVYFSAKPAVNFQGKSNTLWVYNHSKLSDHSDTQQSSKAVKSGESTSVRGDMTDGDICSENIAQRVEPWLVKSDTGDVIPHCYISNELHILHAVGSSSGSLFDYSCSIPQNLQSTTELHCANIRATLIQLLRVLESIPLLQKAFLQNSTLSGSVVEEETNNLTESHGVKKQALLCNENTVSVGSHLKELHISELNKKGSLTSEMTGESAGGVLSIQSFARFLRCIPALEKVMLNNVHLRNELDGRSVTLNSGTNILAVSARDQQCTMDVNALVSLISSIPSKAKVSLVRVNLTWDVDSSTPPLHESLTEFSISGDHRTERNKQSAILPCGKTSLVSAQSKSMKRISFLPSKLDLSKCETTAFTLMRFLSLFPMLKKVTIKNFTFNCTSCENEITLSETLEELAIEDFEDTSENTQMINTLGYILKCMQGLRKMTLIQTITMLSEENFMHLLSCVPELESLKLKKMSFKSNDEESKYKAKVNNTSKREEPQDVLEGSVLYFSNLKELDLSQNNIMDVIPILATDRICLGTVTALKLSSLKAYNIRQSFQNTQGLQHLNVSINSIDPDGAEALGRSFQHTPALQHLDLSRNCICSDGTSALAQSFQHTPTLQHLDLSWNNIGSDGASALAQSFQQTPTLQLLNLSDNSIGSAGASSLAQAFQHTPTLQHLDLSRNNIGLDGASALAQSFKHTPTLQHVDLRYNSIDSDGASTLAQAFQHTPTLQHVGLSDNSIGSDGASALALSFKHTPTLQHVDLSGNRIGSDGASALAQSFKHTPTLQYVGLRGNSIGSDGASTLALSFKHTPTLQYVDLSGNRIGSDGASALAQSFKHTPTLQYVGLRGNSIGSDGVSTLAQSFQHTPTLQHVDLSGNMISPYGASALAQSFQHTPTLQHVDLSGNWIGPNGASALAQSFQHTPTLQHVDLSFNCIGSDGASALAQSFQHTPTLQHVELGYNSIGPDGASAIAQAFQHTPTLQHIELGYNSIGPDGASALAQSFQHTPTLQDVDLSYNSIGPDGASALAQSFQHTPTLQHVDLRHNSIGPDGASALAQSFQHTPTLQDVDLSYNSIGPDGASALAQSFQHTPTLQHIELGYNSIGPDGASALAQSFQHTPTLQHVDLSHNSIGPDGASALAQSFQHTPTLQHVDLSYNSIGSDGASALAQSFQHTPALQYLNLTRNNIGLVGESLVRLALMQLLPNLDLYL